MELSIPHRIDGTSRSCETVKDENGWGTHFKDP